MDINYRVISRSDISQDRLEDVAFISGMMQQHAKDRIAAFGAIRRAAEVARAHDAGTSVDVYLAGIGIRRAIRAAIGSEET